MTLNQKYYILIQRAFFLLLFALAAGTSCNNDGRDGPGPVISELPDAYHTLEEIDTEIDSLVADYPLIVARDSIGTSGEGRDIPAIIISDFPALREGAEPRVKLVGGVHGNEIFSIELMVRFARYLAENYSGTTKDLIDSRYIVIIPVLNPDGYYAGIRYNGAGIDLNRNCSVIYQGEEKFEDSYVNGDEPFSEPEVMALRDYTLGAGGVSSPFHLSATFHSGTVVVNIPFDFAVDEIAEPAEYETIKNFAWAYSTTGDTPFKDQSGYLYDLDMLTDGIINGGDWYEASGTIQDWNYFSAGCLDITIELTNDKAGPEDEEGITEFFNYNLSGLLAYIDAAGLGISGTVTDGTDPLEGVSVYIQDIDPDTEGDQPGDLITTTDSTGWYHKLHYPASYFDSVTLVFEKDGYDTETFPAPAMTESVPSVTLDVSLTAE